MSRPRRRRFLLGFGSLSAGLHLALFLLATTIFPRLGERELTLADVEVVVLPHPPSRSVAARPVPLPAASSEPLRPPAPSMARPASRRQGRSGPSLSRVRPPSPRPQPLLSPEKPTPGSPLHLTMRGPDLTVERDPMPPSATDRGPQQPARPLTAAEEAERTRLKLDAMFAEDQARRDLRSGRVSPTLYDLERAAASTFRPSWSIVEGDRAGTGGIVNSTRNMLRGMAQSYLKNLRDYMHQPDEKTGGAPEMDSTLDDYNRALGSAEENADTVNCTYCVTLRPGAEPVVVLSRSSRRKGYDRLAREALDRGLRLTPLPKNEAPVEACYRFSAGYFTMPPLPMVGCTFDEVHANLMCYYPGKRMLKANVRLARIKPLAPTPSR